MGASFSAGDRRGLRGAGHRSAHPAGRQAPRGFGGGKGRGVVSPTALARESTPFVAVGGKFPPNPRMQPQRLRRCGCMRKPLGRKNIHLRIGGEHDCNNP